MKFSIGLKLCSEEFKYPITYNYRYPGKLPCVSSHGGPIMAELLRQALRHGDHQIKIPKDLGKLQSTTKKTFV